MHSLKPTSLMRLAAFRTSLSKTKAQFLKNFASPSAIEYLAATIVRQFALGTNTLNTPKSQTFYQGTILPTAIYSIYFYGRKKNSCHAPKGPPFVGLAMICGCATLPLALATRQVICAFKRRSTPSAHKYPRLYKNTLIGH